MDDTGGQQASMIAAAFDQAVEMDRNLSEGAQVEARWTQTGNHYRAHGRVVGLTSNGVRVRLESEVDAAWGDAFPAGFEILVPRPFSPRWSPQNGCFPLST